MQATVASRKRDLFQPVTTCIRALSRPLLCGFRRTTTTLTTLLCLAATCSTMKMTYILFYSPFRLVFGTLYPAYASYKAVRTKNVKEYVSKHIIYYMQNKCACCYSTRRFDLIEHLPYAHLYLNKCATDSEFCTFIVSRLIVSLVIVKTSLWFK